MSEKYDKMHQIRLDPQTIKKMKEKQKTIGWKVSISSMANTIILNALTQEQNQQTK